MTGNILIVDDDGSVRSLIVDVLNRNGYSTVDVGTGEEALDYFSKHPDDVDLVILDMVLPGKSGERICRSLKKIKPSLRIVLTSGHWLENEVKYVIDDADGFLKKPFSIKELIRTVMWIMKEKEREIPEEGGIRYTRIPVLYKVTYNYGNFSGEGFVINISENGISMHTEQTEQLFYMGDELEIQFKVSADFTPKFKGIVRNILGSDFGIEIKEIDSEIEERYRQHVNELLQLQKQGIFEVYLR